MTELRYDPDLDDFLPIEDTPEWLELSDIRRVLSRKSDRHCATVIRACLKCGATDRLISPRGLCARHQPEEEGWRGWRPGSPVPFFGANWIPPIGSSRRIG